MEWLKEKIDDLVVEFDTGDSAADIAKTLSVKFQEYVSRNAVLGKLHRMKLTRERVIAPATVKKPRPKRTRMMINKPRPSPSFLPRWEVEPPSIFRCTIFQLDVERCHWPYGDDPPFSYCGASVTNNSYCFFHYQRSLRIKEAAYDEY